MSDTEGNGAEISTPIGKVVWRGKRIAEFIAVLCLFLLFLLAYIIWEHKQDMQILKTDLTSAIKDLSETNKEMVQAQREMNCLIALPQDKRETEYQSPYGFCKRITR